MSADYDGDAKTDSSPVDASGSWGVQSLIAKFASQFSPVTPNDKSASMLLPTPRGVHSAQERGPKSRTISRKLQFDRESNLANLFAAEVTPPPPTNVEVSISGTGVEPQHTRALSRGSVSARADAPMATFEDSLQQDFGCVDSVTSASLMSPPDSSGGHGEPAAASEPAVVSEDPAVSVPNTNEELRPSPKRTLKRHFGRMDDPHAAPALTGEEPADTVG
ncbi:hypothetical protein CYMTET_9809 [Cymbomonas tetramitiformis]|uniref:Uncharacterized protein n=1 Tax=Cymbomonas tetramitiformis TaxID=36881 RepID=A0AAE0LF40_9CHLO|nr:hypothetical protein CYMTET_9809 [Cymbomonas tetramitiformis]